MRSDFSIILAVSSFVIFLLAGGAAADLREDSLRAYAKKFGLIPASQTTSTTSLAKSSVGRELFESELLSLNGKISCRTCHLDEFSSADGLPNAIGVGGTGKGQERMKSGGRVVPRNTLPLWGRGSVGFHTLFWDGKVDGSSGQVVSQFGNSLPSSDPLVVAVHLPFVEIREMVHNDLHVAEDYRNETVGSAKRIFDALTVRIRSNANLGGKVALAFDISVQDVTFSHIAESIAEFIRDEFRIRSTRFHRFAFEGKSLKRDEIDGGILFYGKGRCALCHNGPLFSDLKFHAIPFPQAGFGKNGFGSDFGRYNVTFDDRDLYKFRTPPLFNVVSTGPYSHSGAVSDLAKAIRYHFDPLRHLNLNAMTARNRVDYYRRLSAWSGNNVSIPTLDDGEIQNLIAFLKTLSF